MGQKSCLEAMPRLRAAAARNDSARGVGSAGATMAELDIPGKETEWLLQPRNEGRSHERHRSSEGS